MKIKKLLPIALMATSLLIGCGGGGGGGTKLPEENEDGVHGITITNVEELSALWYTGGITRIATVTLTATNDDPIAPEIAIASGDLEVISSNKKILTATGLNLESGSKAGTVTLAFRFYNTVKYLELTITQKPTNKELYGTAHEGSAKDPFNNEDALIVAKALEGHYDDQTEDFYIKGKVKSFYHAPGSRSDKGCSWYLEPAENGGEKFEAYLIKKADGSQWTADDIWKGATVTFSTPKLAKYNSQYETSTGTLVKVEGKKPEIKTIEATVAEALEVGKALEDGDSTEDHYVVTGYVVKRSGANYFMADTTTPAEDVKDMLELFNVPEADQAKTLSGARIKVTLELKNYHGQVENSAGMTIEVLNEGQEWPINYTALSIKAAREKGLAVANNNDLADDGAYYKVTGYVVGYDSAWNSTYGNVSIKLGTTADATDVLVIYRYVCEEAAVPAVGAIVTFGGNLSKYNTKAEMMNPKLITPTEEIIPDGDEGGGGGVEYDHVTMQSIYESGKANDTVNVKGVYVGAYGNKTNEWYVANGDYAVYLYQVSIPAGLNVGDSVQIKGKLGVYKGLIQIVNTDVEVTKIDEVIAYNTLSYTGGAITKAMLSRPVTLTGTVKTGVAIDGTANKSVTVTVGTTDVTVYVKKSYGLDYTALNTALGTTNNTVTLKGYVAIYDGAATVDYATSTGYQIVSPAVVA